MNMPSSWLSASMSALRVPIPRLLTVVTHFFHPQKPVQNVLGGARLKLSPTNYAMPRQQKRTSNDVFRLCKHHLKLGLPTVMLGVGPCISAI